MKQRDDEEVTAFGSHLDNTVRTAKSHSTELLQDESAVDKHLCFLFWEGLRDSVKDKACHKKDCCKTFTDLISAACHGEKEVISAQTPKRLARAHQTT